jgi:hypothetical protein
MEASRRYFTVLFIGTLFPQLYAIRWLLEIALIKLREIKPRTLFA